MDKELRSNIARFLEAETKRIQESDIDKDKKIKNLQDILHFIQIIDRFDELEPIIQEYLNKEADRRRFPEER